MLKKLIQVFLKAEKQICFEISETDRLKQRNRAFSLTIKAEFRSNGDEATLIRKLKVQNCRFVRIKHHQSTRSEIETEDQRTFPIEYQDATVRRDSHPAGGDYLDINFGKSACALVEVVGKRRISYQFVGKFNRRHDYISIFYQESFKSFPGTPLRKLF